MITEKQHVVPIRREELLGDFPIEGLLDGWYFRVTEVSNGCLRVEGRDVYGREVSCSAVGDVQPALDEYSENARSINQML